SASLEISPARWAAKYMGGLSPPEASPTRKTASSAAVARVPGRPKKAGVGVGGPRIVAAAGFSTCPLPIPRHFQNLRPTGCRLLRAMPRDDSETGPDSFSALVSGWEGRDQNSAS